MIVGDDGYKDGMAFCCFMVYNSVYYRNASGERKMESLIAGGSESFEQFQRNIRNRVDKSLNLILWFGILVGPALAIGIATGAFKRISYLTCFFVSAGMFVLAVVDRIILNWKPYSYVPGVLALVGMEVLTCFMNDSHIYIRITWFIVPLLSLLFCDRWAYIGASILNYVMMGVSTWVGSVHYSEIRVDLASPLAAFINTFSGLTMEAAVMFLAGYALGRATSSYYRTMIGKYKESQSQQEQMREHLNILDSMSRIYDFVNLIDFNESTEMSLREEVLHKLPIAKGQDHTHMTQGLRHRIAPDMADAFWTFTDISTVPDRLVGRRSIAGEFVSTKSGWFRAQYIRVKGEMSKRPDVVIYTIQNIDSEKRREEHLIRISMTDELTRLFNRRCYEEDLTTIEKKALDEDLALISADVNGLKTVNDNMGHSAGDDLLVGAATCLLSALATHGRIYRTGGDEFMAIVHTHDCAELLNRIKRSTDLWHGAIVNSVSISVGYAALKDHPDAGVRELERIADQQMYEAKARYYEETGKDRRKAEIR